MSCATSLSSPLLWLSSIGAALAWSSPAQAVEAGEGRPTGLSIYHVVLADETVAGIARRYGSDIDEIIRINQIEDARLLWIGTRLMVPLIAGTEPAPPAASRAPARRDSLQRRLDSSEAQLREARFEEALEGAGSVRDLLNSRGVGPHDPLRVQVELIAATARIALGEMEAALACLERALQAQPDLELDPVQVSPRVIAALRAARNRAGAQ